MGEQIGDNDHSTVRVRSVLQWERAPQVNPSQGYGVSQWSYQHEIFKINK